MGSSWRLPNQQFERKNNAESSAGCRVPKELLFPYPNPTTCCEGGPRCRGQRPPSLILSTKPDLRECLSRHSRSVHFPEGRHGSDREGDRPSGKGPRRPTPLAEIRSPKVPPWVARCRLSSHRCLGQKGCPMKKIAPGTPRFGVLGALDYVRRLWLFGRGRCRRCGLRFRSRIQTRFADAVSCSCSYPEQTRFLPDLFAR